MEVSGHAGNGKHAVDKINLDIPDIVVLDVEMPVMNGIEALKKIKAKHPHIHVIMFSSHTLEGAKVTIQALELGATDFITKPDKAKVGSPEPYIKEKLIPLLKVLKPIDDQETGSSQSQISGRQSTESIPISLTSNFSVCVIGISTGGPVALRQLIPLLPSNLKGSVMIVQHMPPFFTGQLAKSLNTISSIKIVEGEDGLIIENGVVYLAKGGVHMSLIKEGGDIKIKHSKAPAENSCRPAADFLFRSVAEVYGSAAMGVIMTGMGNDGYLGMKAMKKNKSHLIAQSKQSCMIYGMPRAAVEAGVINESLNINGIASQIKSLLGTT